MRADPLRGQAVGGWALEIKTFWALKWQRAKRVPFEPKKKTSTIPIAVKLNKKKLTRNQQETR
jgi:hypothetical protein